MKSKKEFLREQEVHQINIGGIVYEMVKISQAEKAMERYHEQKLNLSGIGSKRLFTEEDMEKSFNAGCAHRYTDTMKQWNASVKVFPRFKEWIKNFQAACASGGEGKGVSDGHDPEVVKRMWEDESKYGNRAFE